MLRRWILVASLLLAGAAGAAGAAARREELQGRIARVDESTREIVLDARDATTQVKVSKDAQITIDGSSASLGDLKRGEEVRASLERIGDETQVVRIEVVGKGE